MDSTIFSEPQLAEPTPTNPDPEVLRTPPQPGRTPAVAPGAPLRASYGEKAPMPALSLAETSTEAYMGTLKDSLADEADFETDGFEYDEDIITPSGDGESDSDSFSSENSDMDMDMTQDPSRGRGRNIIKVPLKRRGGEIHEDQYINEVKRLRAQVEKLEAAVRKKKSNKRQKNDRKGFRGYILGNAVIRSSVKSPLDAAARSLGSLAQEWANRAATQARNIENHTEELQAMFGRKSDDESTDFKDPKEVRESVENCIHTNIAAGLLSVFATALANVDIPKEVGGGKKALKRYLGCILDEGDDGKLALTLDRLSLSNLIKHVPLTFGGGIDGDVMMRCVELDTYTADTPRGISCGKSCEVTMTVGNVIQGGFDLHSVLNSCDGFSVPRDGDRKPAKGLIESVKPLTNASVCEALRHARISFDHIEARRSALPAQRGEGGKKTATTGEVVHVNLVDDENIQD